MKKFYLKHTLPAFGLLTFSLSFSFQCLAYETYVGVVNVQHNSYSTKNKEYFLYINPKSEPIKLLFDTGKPHVPLLTGDKIQISGTKISGEIQVNKVKYLSIQNINL